ncbi:large conductance mechanosensitive channel protein MscL [Amphibacillus sediminis]|uniref:large conductance mechanosensitive channel protein MscL n=1 Tax=Amphibacillus sediminis TaxID=360185 RepID=UPI00082FFF8E|nr:large conductance mechanosensitive channel protein MscL [Amphibacillus sediminis]
MIKEFKEFIMRGNVVDLAVGVVMGAAFSAIVTALVEHVITPSIIALTGNARVEELYIQVGQAQIKYGEFLQAVMDFLLIALVLFLAIKAMNRLAQKRKKDEQETVEALTAEQYLAEIRDLLAAQNSAEQSSPNKNN